MKKIIIILLPLVLGVTSVVFTGCYFSNHSKAMEIISQTKQSVPVEDFKRVVQQRLSEKVSGVEEYHVLSIVFGILASAFALIACAETWYEELPFFMVIFRFINLIIGFGSLMLSMLRT